MKFRILLQICLVFAPRVGCAPASSSPQSALEVWHAGRPGGLVLASVTPTGAAFAQVGTFAADDPRPVDADTFFEIGSVTKVFTAVLLADADQRGVVKLDDPIGAPSPAGGITYRELVTHTSGLPRMPADFTRGDLGNPYVDQDLDALARSLALHAPDAKPSKSMYSNFGFAVLGAALAAAERTAWTDLVRTRVLDPLGLKRTATSWRDVNARTLAPGHSAQGRAANWDLAAYSPAGGLVSSARELARFAQAALGLVETPINSRLAETMRPLVSGENSDHRFGMAWRVEADGDAEIVWHSGATGGYRSFVGLNPARRTAIVLLTNADLAPEPLGLHLLAGRALPVTTRRATAPELLPLLGNYPLSLSLVITVTAEGNDLFAQATVQPRVRLRPVSRDRYRIDGVPGEIEFRRTENGTAVTALLLHQHGISQSAPRLAPGSMPVMPAELALTPAELDSYVGRYKLDAVEMAITRRGDRLFAQITGQPATRIFAEATERFFFKDVNARLTFHLDGNGQVIALTLHQHGRDVRAARISL